MIDELSFFENDVLDRMYIEGDGVGGRDLLVIRQTQDLEPFGEANRIKRDEGGERRFFTGRDMAEVADIPNIIIAKWMQEGFNIFDPSPETERELRRRLDSSEYKMWKTTNARLASTSRG